MYKEKSVIIFITISDINVLRKRLIERRTDALEVIEKRVKKAENELNMRDKFDYVVLNDKIDKAYSKLEDIIVKERNKIN